MALRRHTGGVPPDTAPVPLSASIDDQQEGIMIGRVF